MDLWHSLVHDLSSPHFPTVMRAILTVLLALVVCWVGVTLLVAMVNRQLAIRIAPPIIRALLIAGLATMLTQPVHAQESGTTSLHGLTLPDRPDTDPTPSAQVGDDETAASHRVSPGDTLWGIARHHLSAQASEAEIAQATRAWHDTNRDVIGTNPDLIHPGQDLKEPRP